MLDLISEFLNKQETVAKLTENEKLHGMGFTDVHIIVAIDKIDHANVTKLAEHMHMTRGAISKAMKRLENQGCVDRYNEPDNQKEVYFKLTDHGRFISEEHHKRHSLWEEKDQEFLSSYKNDEQEFVKRFFTEYNRYLENRIEELEE